MYIDIHVYIYMYMYVYIYILRVCDVWLQKALKEKEEHVEQLLLERDLKRSEVARTTARSEEVSTSLSLQCCFSSI
jgi:hypothetical protein